MGQILPSLFCCAIQAITRLDDAHPHGEGNLLYRVSQSERLSRNTLTVTPGNHVESEHPPAQ